MYPGEARNIAIAKCKNNIIGFLDLNTLPDKKWLYYGYKLIREKYPIVWGRFYCEAISFIEKIMIIFYYFDYIINIINFIFAI